MTQENKQQPNLRNTLEVIRPEKREAFVARILRLKRPKSKSRHLKDIYLTAVQDKNSCKITRIELSEENFCKGVLSNVYDSNKYNIENYYTSLRHCL